MQKWILPTSTVMAMAVSFVLFVFMAYLISKPQAPSMPVLSYKPNINYGMPKEKTPEIKKPKIIEEPEKPTPPPPMSRDLVLPEDEPPVTTEFKIEAPSLNPGESVSLNTSGGLKVFNPQTSGREGDAMPISRVEPLYPIDAARKGLEGWVKLAFDIDKSGSVTNVRVLDAKPKRVFNQAAVKALKRWRYKAKFVAGEAVMQNNVTVQLDFTINR